MQNQDSPFHDTDIISVYTRQQAIEDGIFVDISEIAKEAGFKIPVAITTNLYHTHIVPSQKAKEQGQSENGRLWDVLQMLRFAISSKKDRDDNMITFKVKFQNGKNSVTPEIWAVVESQSPTDPSPAMNILLPSDY